MEVCFHLGSVRWMSMGLRKRGAGGVADQILKSSSFCRHQAAQNLIHCPLYRGPAAIMRERIFDTLADERNPSLTPLIMAEFKRRGFVNVRKTRIDTVDLARLNRCEMIFHLAQQVAGGRGELERKHHAAVAIALHDQKASGQRPSDVYRPAFGEAV